MAECASWCVYYTSRSTNGHCKQCDLYIHMERIGFGEINPFELAKKLEQKQEMNAKIKSLNYQIALIVIHQKHYSTIR